MSTIAVAGIDLYRRYLSPLKGFRCAHHALHGAGSCSTFGREVYASHNLVDATRLLRARFRNCREASLTLHSEVWRRSKGDVPPEDDKDGKKKKSDWDCHTDCGLADLPCDCGF
jgi:putative component of membrane protein insertase Oxa1/YidC/SpoIIIJ protein YidD